MRIELFQSSHGDCLLLESGDGKRILCDGGMSTSMREWVAPTLAARRNAEPQRPIDLVYVSHVDADHIGGILELIRSAVDWKVWDHHQAAGETFSEPDSPRPPDIGAIWHNAFHDQVEDNEGQIEDMLAAAVPVLLATQAPAGLHAGAEMQNVALGVNQAVQLTKLVRSGLRDVPVDRLPGSRRGERLMMARPRQRPIRLGGFEIRIVGPTLDELEKLREGWNNWLRRSGDKVRKIEEEVRRRVEAFAGGHRSDLREWEGVEGFREVTVPNIASLVLLVEEGGRRILLTGDAQHDILLGQLRAVGLLRQSHLHLDVLKVQHHGSEHNMSPEFARTVTADHYLFCGDGQSGNPEPQVIEQIFASRISNDPAIRGQSSEAAEADRPFAFWFSTSTSTPAHGAQARRDFRETERLVQELTARSGGRLTAHFNEGASLTLDL